MDKNIIALSTQQARNMYLAMFNLNVLRLYHRQHLRDTQHPVQSLVAWNGWDRKWEFYCDVPTVISFVANHLLPVAGGCHLRPVRAVYRNTLAIGI